MEKHHVNPPSLAHPPSYTHVVTIEGPGKLIHVAGQVSQDKAGNVVGKGSLEAQVDQAQANLIAALAGVGAKPSDVVKITTYVVNYKPEYRAMIAQKRLAVFGKEAPPAATLVGVQSLALDDFLVEIEAVAAIS
jgi:enamine deaminase RidA (YjgF/YER057c/UK114 family)